jgi:hypothetical protein
VSDTAVIIIFAVFCVGDLAAFVVGLRLRREASKIKGEADAALAEAREIRGVASAMLEEVRHRDEVAFRVAGRGRVQA